LLKDLAKEISHNPDAKVGVTTYRGPPTYCIPKTIRNVQDWHVNPSVLGNAAKKCQKNHEPPFTEAAVSYLESLLGKALLLYKTWSETGEVLVPATGKIA